MMKQSTGSSLRPRAGSPVLYKGSKKMTQETQITIPLGIKNTNMIDMGADTFG